MAGSLDAKIKTGSHDLPFNEIIYCNIGNPHNLGQKPISFFREVMASVQCPDLLTADKLALTSQLFPADAIARAQFILDALPGGIGQYSPSQGVAFVRQHVAEFIAARDGYPASASDIFLTNGASDGIAVLMKVIVRDPTDGIFIPIPQYPLYSATLSLMGAPGIDYTLDESNNWGMSGEQLAEAHAGAVAKGINPRALVVINPGNPTGQVLSEEQMKATLQFCYDHHVVLLADEVYQENVYNSERKWRSFKAVLQEMPAEVRDSVEMASFHSTSKGFIGECGFRGGYMELINIDEEVRGQILKRFSMQLCSNVSGQIMVTNYIYISIYVVITSVTAYMSSYIHLVIYIMLTCLCDYTVYV